ncbi:hypothetical protein LP419_22065 [Massilia sp. H-1]|nr:hypothetical protein LP419_22065 [Massilia sp. H-1]
MDINKRTILWIVFSISLALLWDSWMVSNGNPSFFNPTAQPAKVAQAPAANLPASPTSQTVLSRRCAASGRRRAWCCLQARLPHRPRSRPKSSPSRPMCSRLTSTPCAGVIQRLELLKFHDKIDQTKNQVLMNTATDKLYLAQTGLWNPVA